MKTYIKYPDFSPLNNLIAPKKDNPEIIIKKVKKVITGCFPITEKPGTALSITDKFKRKKMKLIMDKTKRSPKKTAQKIDTIFTNLRSDKENMR